jgi:Zn-dependent alcohol dehydrogenase
VIVKIGSQVEQIKPGMRVLTPFHNSCGNCRM